MAGTWYLSKYFLSSANISLSIYKTEEITRTVALLKIKFNIILLIFFFYDGY